jgi:hypothetical protein
MEIDWSYFVSHVLPVLIIGLFAATRIGFMLTDNSNFKNCGLSKAVYDALEKLYDDREFLRDFVSILQKEENLQDVVTSAISKHKDTYYVCASKGSTSRNRVDDVSFWYNFIWTKLNTNNECDWDAPAARIIHNVIKSNGYKKFSKKYNFTTADDTMMRAVFYYIISRPDFAVNAKEYLYNAIAENQNAIIRAIDRGDFDFTGVSL